MPLDDRGESSHDVPADIANPWKADEEASFSSAVKVKESRPVMRRRGSEGAVRRRNDHDPYLTSHSRAQTLNSSAHTHPLSPSVGKKPIGKEPSHSLSDMLKTFSAHDTRPHMKRVLSDIEIPSDDPSRTGGGAQQRNPVEERIVIMHEVMSRDSLAGVALKYGVTLPDLRRWNQLWPSDPIHLRKILYIPLEKARHAKQFRITVVDIDDDDDAQAVDPAQSDSVAVAAGDRDNNKREPITGMRVPASQLSFFPPPSTPLSAKSLPNSSKSQTFSHPPNSRVSRPTLPPSFVELSEMWQQVREPSPLSSAPYSSLGFSFSGRSQSRGLSALLTSARNTFAERLSLDSATGTGSTQSDEQDWGHELEDVSTGSSVGGNAQGIHTMHASQRSRSTIQQNKEALGQDTLELDRVVARSGSHSDARYGRDDGGLVQQQAVRYSSDRNFVPIAPQSPIRTSQLEPSPGMQLPVIRKR